MDGTRAYPYPRGTRGLIVATCRFSAAAIELAGRSDIRLVDGNEFVNLVRGAGMKLSEDSDNHAGVDRDRAEKKVTDG